MQTMVVDERLGRGSRADHQADDPGQPASAATAATAELVARASVGEQAAWDQLVDRYGAMVWAVARAHGLGPADAGDVSQVTWLLLTQHLGAVREPERLGDWLLRTATREADRMRRLRGGAPDAGAHDLELLLGAACRRSADEPSRPGVTLRCRPTGPARLGEGPFHSSH